MKTTTILVWMTLVRVGRHDLSTTGGAVAVAVGLPPLTNNDSDSDEI